MTDKSASSGIYAKSRMTRKFQVASQNFDPKLNV